MSNNLVFNTTASKLCVLINGKAPSGDTKPIKVDEDGVITLPTVTVTATDLDIRNLSATTDSIATIGLITTSQTTVAANSTTGSIFTQDTGLSNEFSYYVINNDASSITVRMEISPTTANSYFLGDPNQSDVVIGPNGKGMLMASLYTNYSRLYYQATTTPTNFEVYYTSRT